VLLYGLCSGRIERTLATGWAPARVAVSPAWGVVAACGDAGEGAWEVALFAPDGERIGRPRLGDAVAAWEVGGAADGAEWVTVMTAAGDLFRFEIGSADAGQPRPGIKGAIALAFVPEWGAVAVVDQAAIHVLPL
jgi:hypothetical protein